MIKYIPTFPLQRLMSRKALVEWHAYRMVGEENESRFYRNLFDIVSK